MSHQLMIAAVRGDAQKVSVLLEEGADPNFSLRRFWNAFTVAVDSPNFTSEMLDASLPLILARDEPHSEGAEAFCRTYGPLALACIKNHYDAALVLLEAGADPNAADEDGVTPLLWAVHLKAKRLAQLLLRFGADPNVKDSSGVPALVKAGGSELLDSGFVGSYMLAEQRPASCHLTDALEQLRSAAPPELDFKDPREDDCREITRMLIDAGANIHATTAKGTTVLINAVSNGWKDIVERLLAQGADVHAQGPFMGTPLHSALHGRLDIAQLLIDHGADINRPDKFGTTPLFSALGNAKCLEFALSHGADVRYARPEDGFTAMHAALDDERVDMLRILVEHGANVDARTNKGATPLHHAAFGGKVEALRALIELGADIHALTNEGKTPLALTQGESRADRMRRKFEEIKDNPPGSDDLAETKKQLADLRERLETSGVKTSFPDMEQLAAAFQGRMTEMLSGQQETEHAGRAKCAELLKTAGATH